MAPTTRTNSSEGVSGQKTHVLLRQWPTRYHHMPRTHSKAETQGNFRSDCTTSWGERLDGLSDAA